ncbi:MAG: GNAT family N-acetyltransferase [Paracoccaceae bacterium]
MTRTRGSLLLGWLDGKVICGHSTIADGDRAFWLSLASTDEPQDLPRNYALVWAAMQQAQAQGLRWYDMAGGHSRHEAVQGQDSGHATAGTEAGRMQFKSAFAPETSELVPMMVLPLLRPVHAVLFALRQRYRDHMASRRRAIP